MLAFLKALSLVPPDLDLRVYMLLALSSAEAAADWCFPERAHVRFFSFNEDPPLSRRFFLDCPSSTRLKLEAVSFLSVSLNAHVSAIAQYFCCS